MCADEVRSRRAEHAVKLRLSALVVGLFGLGAACASSGSNAAAPTSPTSPTTATAAPAAASSTSSATDPEPNTDPGGADSQLVDMMSGNVATTDLSALVKITSANVVGDKGGPPAATGYVNHVYVADIVTCLHGCGTAKTVAFSEMAEAGIKPHPVGRSMVVSACRSGAGQYFTPDVGYLLPADEIPASAIDALAKKPPPRGDSACKP